MNFLGHETHFFNLTLETMKYFSKYKSKEQSCFHFEITIHVLALSAAFE